MTAEHYSESTLSPLHDQADETIMARQWPPVKLRCDKFGDFNVLAVAVVPVAPMNRSGFESCSDTSRPLQPI
jgi:hypothetical protein